jgi:hypothetical protein
MNVRINPACSGATAAKATSLKWAMIFASRSLGMPPHAIVDIPKSIKEHGP